MPGRTLFPAVFACLLLASGPLCAADQATAHLDRLIASEEWDQAVLLARELDEASPSEIDLTLSLARLARSLQQQDRIDEAAEFYQRSVQASARPTAESLPPDTVVLIRLAASSVLTRTKNWSAAIESVQPLLDDVSAANEEQKSIAVSILLKIGSGALSTGAGSTAAEAYSLSLAHADASQKQTAMLGNAWATAIMRDRPLVAAEKLSAFLEQFPDHADAARAARACIECYKQAGKSNESIQMQNQLLTRWPDSDVAVEVIRSHQNTAPDLVPVAVADWLMHRAKSDDLSVFDPSLTVLGLQIASVREDLKAWGRLAIHLGQIDELGQATSDVLSRLGENSAADAERLATELIAPRDENLVTAKAREAACRWAARGQRWSMLALASETEQLDQDDESRTADVERLMAEALVQTGRPVDALSWWNHLVDHHGADDFATLLRCAEAETSVGRDASAAEKRIQAAHDAAGEDRFQLALVNLLDAELSIRRSQFDQARALLENVVRESDTDAGIRARAQWLIGETFYLQQNFKDAIEAYRRVEGIDPGGIWVAPSLVQAGKSFEHLGRRREASVCYGHLLSRFADSAHAATARRRMAALNEPANDNSSQPTIRR